MTAPPDPRVRRPARPRATEAAIVAAAGVGVTVLFAVGISRPSLWFDEAATLSGASRGMGDLLALTREIDAVHGAYYTLMHAWLGVAGTSAFALRLPSAVFAGCFVVAVYALARRWGGPWTAAAAALVAAALPRTTWMATEGRSFALVALLCTLVALALVGLVRAETAVRRRAVLFGALAWLLSAVYLFAALVPIALVAALWTDPRSRSRARVATVALLAAGAAAAPLGIAVWMQRDQLGGVRPLGATTPADLGVEGLFLQAPVVAAVVGAVLLSGGLTFLVRRRRGDAPAEGAPHTGPFLVWWMLLPPAVLLAASFGGADVFQPRQLTMIAPAAALAVAFAARALAGRPGAVAAALLVAALSVPSWASARAPEAKGTDWREAAAALRDDAPRDAAVLYLPSWTSVDAVRMSVGALPSAYAVAQPDPALRRTPEASATLFGVRASVAETDLRAYDAVVTVRGDRSTLPRDARPWVRATEERAEAAADADAAALARAGFVPGDVLYAGRTIVQEWARG